jgi:hypothetical protein
VRARVSSNRFVCLPPLASATFKGLRDEGGLEAEGAGLRISRFRVTGCCSGLGLGVGSSTGWHTSQLSVPSSLQSLWGGERRHTRNL